MRGKAHCSRPIERCARTDGELPAVFKHRVTNCQCRVQASRHTLRFPFFLIAPLPPVASAFRLFFLAPFHSRSLMLVGATAGVEKLLDLYVRFFGTTVSNQFASSLPFMPLHSSRLLISFRFCISSCREIQAPTFHLHFVAIVASDLSLR
jgi:hypothetical protein